MKRVLITGASGFIGSYLVEHLNGFDLRTISLRDPDWVHQPLNCDVIIHCAGLAHATSKISEETYHRVNCELTKQLAEKAMQEQVTQFIYLSTALVFGEGHVGAITMDSPLQPVSAYAKSKLCGEEAILNASPLPSLILRLPLVLGDSPKGNLRSLAKLAKVSPLFLKIPNRRSILTLQDLGYLIQDAITQTLEGVRHPKSYDCSTSDLFSKYRKTFWMLPVPQSWIVTLRTRSRFFSKLFGDFYYNNLEERRSI